PWIEVYQNDIPKNSLLMDISGVKTNIVKPIQDVLREDLELLSIHPMCGRESRGIEFSDETIFKGSNFILVPTQKNKNETVEAVKELANKMEFGRICTLSIEEHDKMIGFLSQLTHVIAVSLMNTHDNAHLVEYTGDSFRDLTRIAKINEDLWTELFIMNKDILLDEINQFIDSISHFRDSLEQEDTQEMKRLFIQSTKRRDKFNKTDAKKR
ncbi:prephenate dehydrogenase, partial [Holdemanella porci]